MASGVSVSGFRGLVEAEPLLEKRLVVRVEAARVTVSRAVLPLSPPDGSPLTLIRFQPGRLILQSAFTPVTATIEAVPTATPAGLLRITLASIRAGGLLPLPPALVIAAIRPFLTGKPGLTVTADNALEIDLSEVLAPFGPPQARVSLPPLRSVTVDAEVLHLEF